MNGIIILIVFIIIFISVIIIEIYVPEASKIVTLGLKAASVATAASIVVFSMILWYQWNVNGLFKNEHLIPILSSAVKEGIKQVSNEAMGDVKNTVVNTMDILSESTKELSSSLLNISTSVKKNRQEIQE